VPFTPATDQHPSHSVAEGEKLIKRIYETLRASPQWNNTAFLITYDEARAPPPRFNLNIFEFKI